MSRTAWGHLWNIRDGLQHALEGGGGGGGGETASFNRTVSLSL